MKALQEYKETFLNLIYPHNGLCLVCGDNDMDEQINHYFGLCRYCLSEITIICGVTCEQCGLPIPSANEWVEYLGDATHSHDNICDECGQYFPIFTKTITACQYNSMLRKMIFDLKYSRKTYLALPLAKIMAQMLIQKINVDEIDMIIPVPLNDKRKKERGFNQMDLVGEQLSLILNIPCQSNALKRIKNTKALNGLGREDRIDMISGAFKSGDVNVFGAKVLLIDDIFTTGSTLRECAAILKAAGAIAIFVGVLAGARLRDENLL